MTNKLERHLEVLKEQRHELIDKYSGRSGLEDALKTLDTNVDLIKKELGNVGDMKRNVDLPNIPMGKNTHVNKTNDGFVYNKSKIKVDRKLKENMGLTQQLAVVQSAWNDLPDDVRDIVKTLNLKMSRASGRNGFQGGKWTDETGELVLNMHPKSSHVMHNFYHEVGHARFHQIEKTNPEKVRKFEERISKHRAPTKYSESYRHVADGEAEYQRKKIREFARRGIPMSDTNKKILEQRTKVVSNLYENETHSELNAYAMGELPDSYITVINDTMKDLLNAYKELWGIEQ
jgi:hypothetical protein